MCFIFDLFAHSYELAASGSVVVCATLLFDPSKHLAGSIDEKVSDSGSIYSGDTLLSSNLLVQFYIPAILMIVEFHS